MKKLSILLFFAAITAVVTSFLPQFETESEESETAVDEWLYAQKAFPYGKADKFAQRNAVEHMQAARNQQKLFKTDADGDDWDFIGPLNIGGRVLDIDCPAGNENVIYVGTASGGVLKSTNGGATWANIFDAQSTLSIGDIAIDPVDTATIYIGTGPTV